MSDVRIRPARPTEAAILAEMANDLNDHVGIRGRPFTPERVRADGFGAAPASPRWSPSSTARWRATCSSAPATTRVSQIFSSPQEGGGAITVPA